MIDAWITKYLFTRGIIKMRGSVEAGGSMFRTTSNGYPVFFHGDDWHRTSEAANEHARGAIQRRRVSLKKQLAALDKLEKEI